MMISWLEIAGIFLGGAMGWLIPWFDKIAYVYILHPETQVAQYFKYYVGKKDYKQAFKILNIRGGEMDKLTTRSVLFQVVWVALAVFTVTSVISWFGKSLVMSLGLRILISEWQEYSKNRPDLKQKLFWQIKREVCDEELKWYMYVGTGVFIWLVWLMF